MSAHTIKWLNKWIEDKSEKEQTIQGDMFCQEGVCREQKVWQRYKNIHSKGRQEIATAPSIL